MMSSMGCAENRSGPDAQVESAIKRPTRALRDEINTRIREHLVAEGVVSGPARQGEKLVPRDLTRAEMARASNYSARVNPEVNTTKETECVGA